MTNPSIIVAPSILSANLCTLETEIDSVVQAGADWLHVDVMDGRFVPPITFGANMVKALSGLTSTFLDVHLMIVEPDKHIQSFTDAGSGRITVHQEACPHLHRTLSTIRDSGTKAGVAVNPGTPVESIYDVLDLVDLVLVMTVNPGWGGQSLISSCLKKVETLRAELDRRGNSTHIEVDGGVSPQTAGSCLSAGATALVAGSAIFGSADRSGVIASLRGESKRV